MRIVARALVPGVAEGLVVSIAPLSFWGGFDAATGLITDRSHPSLGHSLAGTVLVMAAGRGSSSSSSVLAEAIRRTTGPRAIVLAQADPVLSVGALVARTLYGAVCPVVVVEPHVHAGLAEGTHLHIEAGDETAVLTG